MTLFSREFFDGLSCHACHLGRFNNHSTGPPWPRECDSCPAGYVSTKLGQSVCTECPIGKIANDDRTICADCEAGTKLCLASSGSSKPSELKGKPEAATAAKLLFRQGMALVAHDKPREALDKFGDAEKLDPKNDQIKQSIGMANMKVRKMMAGA